MLTTAQKQVSGGKIAFSTKVAGAIRHPRAKNTTQGRRPTLTPYSETSSSCIMNLNIKHNTIKLLE